MPCLAGLKLILDNQISTDIELLPSVNLYDYDGPQNDPAYQKMIDKHKAELVVYNKVKFQNELIRQREILTQKVIELYSREPYEDEELSQIAEDIIKDRQVVEKIIVDVKRQRANSKNKDNMP